MFASKNDPDYQKILAMCQAGQAHLAEIKRFDMPGFAPPAPYVREMRRYGILPANIEDETTINGYQTDREYWRSLWYSPPERVSAY